MRYDLEYIYNVGVLDESGEELDELCISAKSEEEMWEIFDEEVAEKFPGIECDGVIYDCNLN